ncbi:MAG: acetyl-CoA carboxylase, carboxyltransferase subunit beta [Vampirovibrionales bacterium]|nr:acetyl-CoA carboxylase, carboxyltransferase subunit beta [Vampirovibrionales bacterium]
MSLKDWFESKRRIKRLDASDADVPGAERASKSAEQGPIAVLLNEETLCKLWTTCFSCKNTLPTKQLADLMHVCPECGYHFRINARTRIAQLVDKDLDLPHGLMFEELDAGLSPADPLVFTDTQPYRKRQAEARQKSGLNDAIITGLAQIQGEACGLAVMDFDYMGGSMGSVVGEKLTRLIERCLSDRLPLLIVTASGGARMQEGMFSLMQMVKTGVALANMHDAGLLVTVLLTEPTFGGVTASFGMLGDIMIAEEGARVGFAGRRVIEQTIRQKLPSDFQTAGYLMQYGQVDMMVKRPALKETLGRLMRLHRMSGQFSRQPAMV